jgi:hypothetical protein
MPIGASAGTLDIENATLRSNAIAVLTNLVTGNDAVRSSGAPTLEVYGDPSNGGNEARLELVSNLSVENSKSFTRLTSNAGVFSIQSGTDGSTNGPITFGGFSNERMRITADGNVGIGTTSPRSPLTVYNGEGAHITSTYTVNYSQYSILDFNYGGGVSGTPSSIRLICNAVNRDNGAGPNYDYGAQGKLIFQGKTNNLFSGGGTDTSYTNIMTVDGATKRVGIGTTSPIRKLDVRSGDGQSASGWISGVFGPATGLTTNPRVVMGTFSNVATIGGHNGDLTAWSDLVINLGGNVGIGTTNPGATLDIRGSVSNPSIPTVHIGDNTADYNGDYGMVNLVRNPAESGTKAHLAFIRSGNTIFSQGYYNNTNTFGFWPSFASVTNTPAMAFATNGNVGIGTTDPKGPFHVNFDKAIINKQMSLQTLNVYKNAGGNSGTQTRRYYRVYVPNSYANFIIIFQGFARNYSGGGDVQAWRRQYTIQRNFGAIIGITHNSGEDINATGFTFATDQSGSATTVIEAHFDVTFPNKPEGSTYITFTAQVIGDTGYFAENTSV